jgi:hypothetical protein
VAKQEKQTGKQAQQGQGATAHAEHPAPKKGDSFHCESCGMAMEITADCTCENGDHVHFECCGTEMARG